MVGKVREKEREKERKKESQNDTRLPLSSVSPHRVLCKLQGLPALAAAAAAAPLLLLRSELSWVELSECVFSATVSFSSALP